MNPVLTAVLFALDAGVVLVAAWWLSGRFLNEAGSALEKFLAWLVGVALLVGVAGSVLGLTGHLNAPAQLGGHALFLLAVWVSRRFDWHKESVRFSGWIDDIRGHLRGNGPAPWGAGALGAVLSGLAVLAAFAQPVVYDALTYRLPRMALWLQEGRIWHFETVDARLNYMPWLPDLLGVWLLGATQEGYALLALPQAIGGLMLVAATMGLGRLAGLGRAAAIGAAALLLGCANVAVQFTTPQTDLLTAGLLNAGLYLWLAAARRASGSFAGGAGIALALASKGTVLYFAPGLLVIAAYGLWRQPRVWRAQVSTVAGATAPLLALIVPWMIFNHGTYGGWNGPAEAVRLHHGSSLSWRERAEKIAQNLAGSSIQVLDPHAQPWGLQAAARATAKPLLERLPANGTDKHAFEEMNRRELLSRVITSRVPDADVLGVGVLQVGLFILGVLSLTWRDPSGLRDNALLRVATMATLGQVCFQHGLVQWHSWGFRFLVLAMPWAALVMTAGLESLPDKIGRISWMLAVGASALVFVPVVLSTHQSGWQSVIAPEKSGPHGLFLSWRSFARGLEPSKGGFVVTMPVNRPLAAFLRLKAAPKVVLKRQDLRADRRVISALGEEEAWLITPVLAYAGREDGAFVQTWLPPWPEFRDFGLAAHRRLRAGEKQPAALYVNEPADTHAYARRRLVVRAGPDGSVGLKLISQRSSPCRWLVITPQGEQRGDLPASGLMAVVLKLPPSVLSEVFVAFSGSPAERTPLIELHSEPYQSGP